jgi:hypothetical protein
VQDKLVNRMAGFIQLERDIRGAESDEALGFILTNYLRKLLAYDVSLIAVDETVSLGGGLPSSEAMKAPNGDKPASKRIKRCRVKTVSGVSEFDRDAPLVSFAEQLINHRNTTIVDTQVHREESVPASLVHLFRDLAFSELATVAFNQGGAVLVLARKSAWQLSELQLLQQVSDVVSHARTALLIRSTPKRNSLFNGLSRWQAPSWRWVFAAAFVLALMPIRQSVIATGEVSPANPAVIASGLDAVVKTIEVSPNQKVLKGDVLVRFDATDLLHEKRSIESEIRLNQEKLRKASQHSLGRNNEANLFIELQTQIELKALELKYVNERIERLEVRAPRDGVALFSRKKDWEGRAVATGEKIMEVASTEDKQFEIWLAADDAIGIERGTQVRFFPDANPLATVNAVVAQSSYFAASVNGTDQAYRVLANLESAANKTDTSSDAEALRLGMKGTFRLYGHRVSLAYQLIRKPIAVIRRTVGV